jgi:iron complex transport system ATP-binding protein
MSLHEFELAGVISDKVISVMKEGIGPVGTPEEILKPAVLKKLYGITDDQFELLLNSMRFTL